MRRFGGPDERSIDRGRSRLIPHTLVDRLILKREQQAAQSFIPG
jgi:hypothetical protein